MRDKASPPWLAWLGGALIGAILAGFGVAAVLIGQRPQADIDADTLCAAGPPPAWTIVLADSSDALSPRQKKRFAAAVASEVATLPVGGRLSVLSPSDRDPRKPVTLFSKCTPSDAAHANAWQENTRGVAARRAADFDAPLAAAVERAGAGRVEKASPLTDAVRAAATDPAFRAAPQRRLVLVSDMMEFRPGQFSLYAAGATYEAFRKSAPGVAGPPDLSGVCVRIVAFDRPEQEAAQIAARASFWAPWFKDAAPNAITWDP